MLNMYLTPWLFIGETPNLLSRATTTAAGRMTVIRPYAKLSIRPIMQSTRLWKVVGWNACRTLIGSGRREFRSSHNHRDFRKSMSESGAR